MTLNIEQYEYMSGPNTDAGLKVGFICLKYFFGRNQNIISHNWRLLQKRGIRKHTQCHFIFDFIPFIQILNIPNISKP